VTGVQNDENRAAAKATGVMRRHAHGATRKPPVERPGNGFGRSVRPGPPKHWRGSDAYATARNWNPSDLLVVDLIERDDAVAV
jgi:hypothetical protein